MPESNLMSGESSNVPTLKIVYIFSCDKPLFTLIIFIMLPVFIYLYIKKILEYLKFKKEMKEKAKLYTGENSITNKSIKERYLELLKKEKEEKRKENW